MNVMGNKVDRAARCGHAPTCVRTQILFGDEGKEGLPTHVAMLAGLISHEPCDDRRRQARQPRMHSVRPALLASQDDTISRERARQGRMDARDLQVPRSIRLFTRRS
jgi:hypothetical protein